MSIQTDLPILLSATYRLQWEEAHGMFVLLYPEGLVELNQSSAEILQICDGQLTLNDIVSILEEKFSTNRLESDIMSFLNTALDNGWITQST